MSRRASSKQHAAPEPPPEPEVLDLPQPGGELLLGIDEAQRQLDAARQRYLDFVTGLLNGRGLTGTYAPASTPDGYKLLLLTEVAEPGAGESAEVAEQ